MIDEEGAAPIAEVDETEADATMAVSASQLGSAVVQPGADEVELDWLPPISGGMSPLAVAFARHLVNEAEAHRQETDPREGSTARRRSVLEAAPSSPDMPIEKATGRLILMADELAGTIVPEEHGPRPRGIPEMDGLLVGIRAAIDTSRRSPEAGELSESEPQAELAVEPARDSAVEPEPQAELLQVPEPEPAPDLAVEPELQPEREPEPIEMSTHTIEEPEPGPYSNAAESTLVPEAPTVPESRAALRRRRGRRRFLLGFFTWMRNIGLLVILFAAWQLWGTGIGQARAQSDLQRQFAASTKAADHSSAPDAPLVPASSLLPQPKVGSPIAKIQIPAIGVSQVVLEGTGADQLAQGPGHYVGTSLPGQGGNVAVAGHRTTHGGPFGNLNLVEPGDTIELTAASGQVFTYMVDKAPVAVSPNDVSILNDAGDNRITLTTCNPKYQATQRLVVVGILETAAGTAAHHAAVVRKLPSADADTNRWNMGELPWVLGFLAVLVALGAGRRTFTNRVGLVWTWVVLTPLWLVGLFAFYTVVTSFLPASA